MFGVLLVSFLFVLPFQFSYADKYEFANFNTHSGTCFGLTFSDPVFEKDMYILKGKHRTGLIDMFVYPEGQEPRIVFKSPQRLIRTDIKYYPKESHIGVFAKLDYGQGWCKVSFDLMTVNLSEDVQTASSGNSSLMTLSDKKLCMYATSVNPEYLEEAERRGLSCGVGEATTSEIVTANNSSCGPNNPQNCDSAYLCMKATNPLGNWTKKPYWSSVVQEAKRRGLSCGVVAGNTTSNSSIANLDDTTLCSIAQTKGGENWSYVTKRYVEEVKRRGLNCELDRTVSSSFFANMDNDYICMIATSHRNWSKVHTQYVIEAKSRGLSCGVTEASTTQTASTTNTQSNTPTSAELTAAQKEAERLRQQLAALKAKQEKQQQTISSDKQKPVINIAGTAMNGPQGTIKGYVRDNTGVAEVRVDGKLVKVDSYGNFMANTYVPDGGINISIEAVDLAGLTSFMLPLID